MHDDDLKIFLDGLKNFIKKGSKKNLPVFAISRPGPRSVYSKFSPVFDLGAFD